MEAKKKDEAEAAVVMWQQAAAGGSGSSGSPAKAKATTSQNDASLEAALIGEDEQEAISQAAAAAVRKAAAPAAAARPATTTAPPKDEDEGDGVTKGVVEAKRGKTRPDVPAVETSTSGAALVAAVAAATLRAWTPTPAVTLPASFSFASPLAPTSRSPSPQQAWGPAFGIGAGRKPSPDQSHSPPPATIPASAVATASPPDMVAALSAAVAASRKRPLLVGEDSACGAASPELLSLGSLPSPPQDDDRATRALLSPWLLLDGSPTFGAKGGPQVPAVAPEDLLAGAEQLRKRLRVEVARTREVQEEMRLLLNPPTTTSG